MNDCMNAEAREALPDLIHGRLSDLDRATMTAHVDSCADCRAEVDLLNQVRASAPLAPHVDVNIIVAALPVPIPAGGGLLQSPARIPQARNSQRGIWKWAAAAAVLITGGLTFATARRQPETSVAVSSVSAPAVSSPVVPAAPSQPVVSSPAVVDQPRVPGAESVVPSRRVAALSLTGGVQDLSDEQLQTLLNDLDNVQGLPSAEPEAVSIGVDDNEGIQ